MTPRLRTAAGALAATAVVAFIVSFIAGLGRGGSGSERTGPGGALQEPAAGRRVRVEVLNAAGRAGLARDATRRLRARGFDVVYFGNASEFGRDSSVVLDRAGDLDAARDVAAALGIAAVRSEPDGALLLEVSVILGEDWPPRAQVRPPGVRGHLRALWRWVRGERAG